MRRLQLLVRVAHLFMLAGAGCSPDHTPKRDGVAPSVSLGDPLLVAAGAPVTLHATVVSAATSLSYTWRVARAPDCSRDAALVPTGPDATLTPDCHGDFFVLVAANDGTAESPPAVQVVSARLGNHPPVAAVSGPATAHVGDTVTLDGSGSSDPDGDALTYTWTRAAHIQNSMSSFVGLDPAAPELEIDAAGDWIIALTVSDGFSVSAPVVLVITTPEVSSPRPIANAGPDRSGIVGQPVFLDGTASTAASGGPLSFEWFVDWGGCSNCLVYPFVPTAAGWYIAALTVREGPAHGGLDSLPDLALVSVTDPAAADPVVVAPSVVEAEVGSETVVPAGGVVDKIEWLVVARPSCSTVDLYEGWPWPGATAMYAFVPDCAGDYVLAARGIVGSIRTLPAIIRVHAKDGSQPQPGAQPRPGALPVVTSRSPPWVDPRADNPWSCTNITSLSALTYGADRFSTAYQLRWTWTVSASPAGGAASVSCDWAVTDATSVTCDAPEAMLAVGAIDGDYSVTVVVSDDLGNASDPAALTVSRARCTGILVPPWVALDGRTRLPGETLSFWDQNEPLRTTPVTYTWYLDKPVGSQVTLADPHVTVPTITTDVAGFYDATLVIDDGVHSARGPSAQVCVDTPAMPVSSVPAYIRPLERFVLDASGSYDPDGGAVATRFAWVSGPAACGSCSDWWVRCDCLRNSVMERPAPGEYQLDLWVDSDLHCQPSSSLRVSLATNAAPTVSVGGPYRTQVGAPVTLTASVADPESDPLALAWSVVSAASGSHPALTDVATTAPTFTPDVAGVYVLALTVTDRVGPTTATTTVTTPLPFDPVCGGDTVTRGGVSGLVTITGTVSDLAPLCDGWVLIANAGTSRIDLHNVLSGEMRPSWAFDAAPVRVEVDRWHGRAFVLPANASGVTRIDLVSGGLAVLPAGRPVRDVAVLGGGQWLVLDASADGGRRRLMVMNADTGEVTATVDDRFASMLVAAEAPVVVTASGASPYDRRRYTVEVTTGALISGQVAGGAATYASAVPDLPIAISADGAHLAEPLRAGAVTADRSVTDLTLALGTWPESATGVAARFAGSSALFKVRPLDTASSPPAWPQMSVLDVASHAVARTIELPRCPDRPDMTGDTSWVSRIGPVRFSPGDGVAYLRVPCPGGDAVAFIAP